MIMVPIYGVSSFISLFSLEAAVFIDAVRDIYEAFVIYCFFQLLLSYLGGERSLLILLHGRPPKAPPFPINLFKQELDVSDPYTFLFLKRGILQYVQVKPVLALATVILRANSGYLYVSIIYNISICLSLYCLAMFWIVVNDDLKPFRPVPKFLCVKGILFFSFWQSILISILGPYTDSESISLGLTDTLICMEMPLFAFAHLFAFAYTDFIDKDKSFVARMKVSYAFRDAFSFLDVVEDSKATLRGEGMDYREFEPSEGFMHQGAGRDKRIRAGLRYSKGGKRKYWLPKTAPETLPPGRFERGVNRGADQGESVHAPLLQGDADDVLFDHNYNYPVIDASSEDARAVIWDLEERVLRDERGAWFSPIRGAKGRVAMKRRDGPAWRGYGAVGTTKQKRTEDYSDAKVIDFERDVVPEAMDVKMRWSKKHDPSPSSSPGPSSAESSTGPGRRSRLSSLLAKSPPQSHEPPVLPSDAVDLIVEDKDAMRERRKGEPAIRSPLRKVYRRGFVKHDDEGRRTEGEVEVEGSGSQEPDNRIQAGEEVLVEVGGEGEQEASVHEEEAEETFSPVHEAEGVIARAETPPPHTRLLIDHLDDDNPWA
ncbi:organic solute transporter Ostalpha-domain-containing protein [Desarmillaria tabescens]|uniref:Organic solute transporter Ostalpha-domain-containing protein n=1 Tax=Armillaria tabescens TaxID=1929756 RepID=A0AA39TRQ4_ARMTA|nr:organic solute transporter Ostalpha-domain-containing protein [Desarmillaria tabescens]KAK0461624.1 organic solute transporter Ostalpha-domain-containing protein [Desarmillaria tabescens]